MSVNKNKSDAAPKKQVKKIFPTNEAGYIFPGKDLKNSTIDNQIDAPIYRIFPIRRFIQILTAIEQTLIKSKKWDDLFENALLSSDFISEGKTAAFSAKDSIYGQCWTLHRETDAMWRIYSPNKDGVR